MQYFSSAGPMSEQATYWLYINIFKGIINRYIQKSLYTQEKYNKRKINYSAVHKSSLFSHRKKQKGMMLDIHQAITTMKTGNVISSS